MTRRAGAIEWTDGDSLSKIAKHPERATPAAVKAMALRLFDHGAGARPAHVLPPGLHVHKPLPVGDARAVVDWDTVGTAVHSRSRGWLPHVMVTIKHDKADGGGDPQTLSLLVPAELIETLMEQTHETAQRTFLDAMTGPVEG